MTKSELLFFCWIKVNGNRYVGKSAAKFEMMTVIKTLL
jgi:hypothetical protein